MPFVGVTLLVLAAAVNADVGALVETRAGRAPIVPGQPAENAAISAVTPMAGAEATTQVVNVRLQYSPRLSWVFADEAPGSTYVLHQGALSMQWRTGPGSVWALRATGETGETDYSALTQLLGRAQSAIPVVKGFTMFQGGITGTQALARDWRFELASDAILRIPLVSTTKAESTAIPTPSDPSEPPPDPAQTPGQTSATTPIYRFPDETSLSLTPSLAHPISRQDVLSFRIGVNYGALSTGLRVLSVAPQLAWARTMSPTTAVHATAGIIHAEPLRKNAPGTNLYGGTTSVAGTSPIGDVGITSRLYGARGLTISGAYNAAVAWYLDPVLGALGAQGTTGLQLTADLPPSWSMGIDSVFTTSLRSHPLPGAPDETLLTGVLPIRYRPRRNFYVEFGGRAAARAPHIQSSGFAFHRPELWAYLMLGGTFGTRRGS